MGRGVRYFTLGRGTLTRSPTGLYFVSHEPLAGTRPIAPLAEKITEYINDHQDDAAQEDRWRTTMKRETMKRFREQRAAIDQLETAMLMKVDETMEQLIKSIHSSALAVSEVRK